MQLKYNNDNLREYDVWCDDNRDELYAYFLNTKSVDQLRDGLPTPSETEAEAEFYQNEYDRTIIEDGYRISYKDNIPNKDQAIKATLAKYPMMSVASATYYVVEVLGYSEHS